MNRKGQVNVGGVLFIIFVVVVVILSIAVLRINKKVDMIAKAEGLSRVASISQEHYEKNDGTVLYPTCQGDCAQ